MTFRVRDRVKEQSNSSGLGAMTLDGTLPGFQTFLSAVGANNTTTYLIVGGVQWEVGEGTVNSGSPPTLSRNILLASNTGAFVNFAPGVKVIGCVLAASRSVLGIFTTLTVTFGSLGAHLSVDSGNIPVTGVLANDVVLISQPASAPVGIIYEGRAVSDGFIKLRAYNTTTTTQNLTVITLRLASFRPSNL